MTEILLKWSKAILELIPIVIISVFGAFTRVLVSKKDHEKLQISEMLTEMFIAVFAGVIISWILTEVNLHENLKAACIAMSGYSARGFLKLISNKFLNKIKEI